MGFLPWDEPVFFAYEIASTGFLDLATSTQGSNSRVLCMCCEQLLRGEDRKVFTLILYVDFVSLDVCKAVDGATSSNHLSLTGQTRESGSLDS